MPASSRRTPPSTAGETALLDAWQRTVRRHHGKRAIVEAASGQACTFDELAARATAWRARHVPAEAALRGRAVVFAVPNGIAWFEMFLGLAEAGAVLVPLDPGEPPVEQRRVALALRAAGWWDGTRVIALPRPRTYRSPETCLIKLTSGTTGAPRPLVFTAGQLLADGRQVCAAMGIRFQDLNYALIPFGHSYGLGNLVVPLLAQGVPLVCGAAPLPSAIAADFARWQPTVFPSVPAVWRALCSAELGLDALRSLRLAISAGAPLPTDVAREFVVRYRRRIHAFYGSSETGGIAFDRGGTATLAGGVGRPLGGVKLTPITGGRVRVASAAVFTQGNRRPGSWVPPDRVAIDRHGELALLGRRGTIAKIAGRRVNLAEISTRLRGLPGVQEVWVGTGGDGAGVLGAAVVSARSPAELRAALLADSAPWKIPKKWAVLEQFPVTARGKTDVHALQAAVFGH